MEYTIVTALFDIKRYVLNRLKNEHKKYKLLNPKVITIPIPSFKWRSIESYFSLFRWIYKLDKPTIIYMEPHLIDRFNVLYPQTDRTSKIIIIPITIDELPALQKLNKIKNISSVDYKGKDMTVFKEYSAVIASKTHILKLASEYIRDKGIGTSNYPSSPLMWIDFGIAHINVPSTIQFLDEIQSHIEKSVKENKITTVMIEPTTKDEISNMKKFLSIDTMKIAAGLIIVPRNKIIDPTNNTNFTTIDWFANEIEKLYDYILSEYNMCCLEEQLFSVLTARNPTKFRYIYGFYWFMSNLKYTRQHYDYVINSLSKCRLAVQISKDKYYYVIGMDILDTLLRTVKESDIFWRQKQICKILYEGQIISYYQDKELSKRLSRLITYLYHYNEISKTHFNSYKSLKSNLSYSGIDLDIDPGTEILNTEDAEYIWDIL